MNKIKNNPIVKKIGFNRIVLLCVLVLMYVIFAVLEPTFLSYPRILSALNYAYFLGFLALGATFVIATGGIDFSIGTVMFCSALISGQLLTKNNLPLAAALIVCILVGTTFGVLNGIMVAYMGLPSFISSMASMLLSKGIGTAFTKAQAVSWPQAAQGGWFRDLVKINVGTAAIPTGLICLAVVAILCSIILNKTKAGRYILCLGSNKEAVRLSGVNVKKWEMSAYIICGILVGISAIFFTAAYTTVQPGYGDQYNNEAM